MSWGSLRLRKLLLYPPELRRREPDSTASRERGRELLAADVVERGAQEPAATDAGMLMTCGASIQASCRRPADFVDRILQGATPADLLAERSTQFDLKINLKTRRPWADHSPDLTGASANRVIE